MNLTLHKWRRFYTQHMWRTKTFESNSSPLCRPCVSVPTFSDRRWIPENNAILRGILQTEIKYIHLRLSKRFFDDVNIPHPEQYPWPRTQWPITTPVTKQRIIGREIGELSARLCTSSNWSSRVTNHSSRQTFLVKIFIHIREEVKCTRLKLIYSPTAKEVPLAIYLVSHFRIYITIYNANFIDINISFSISIAIAFDWHNICSCFSVLLVGLLHECQVLFIIANVVPVWPL